MGLEASKHYDEAMQRRLYEGLRKVDLHESAESEAAQAARRPHEAEQNDLSKVQRLSKAKNEAWKEEKKARRIAEQDPTNPIAQENVRLAIKARKKSQKKYKRACRIAEQRAGLSEEGVDPGELQARHERSEAARLAHKAKTKARHAKSKARKMERRRPLHPK